MWTTMRGVRRGMCTRYIKWRMPMDAKLVVAKGSCTANCCTQSQITLISVAQTFYIHIIIMISFLYVAQENIIIKFFNYCLFNIERFEFIFIFLRDTLYIYSWILNLKYIYLDICWLYIKCNERETSSRHWIPGQYARPPHQPQLNFTVSHLVIHMYIYIRIALYTKQKKVIERDIVRFSRVYYHHHTSLYTFRNTYMYINKRNINYYHESLC